MYIYVEIDVYMGGVDGDVCMFEKIRSLVLGQTDWLKLPEAEKREKLRALLLRRNKKILVYLCRCL